MGVVEGKGVVLALALVVLNVCVVCNGGSSSTFVRKVEKTVDMPLDSDVFAVPSGYNAPQQVHTYIHTYPNIFFLTYYLIWIFFNFEFWVFC